MSDSASLAHLIKCVRKLLVNVYSTLRLSHTMWCMYLLLPAQLVCCSQLQIREIRFGLNETELTWFLMHCLCLCSGLFFILFWQQHLHTARCRAGFTTHECPQKWGVRGDEVKVPSQAPHNPPDQSLDRIQLATSISVQSPALYVASSSPPPNTSVLLGGLEKAPVMIYRGRGQGRVRESV